MESERIKQQVHTAPLQSKQRQQRIQFEDNRSSAIALTKLANAIQRTSLPKTPSANDIIQRVPHVKFYPETHLPSEETLEGSHTNPVIILESFGPDANQLTNIQTMANQYNGQTMAILGINDKITTGELPANIPGSLNTKADALKEIGPIAAHQVVVAPFTWKQPSKAAADYDFPYMEARGQLMQIAERKAADIASPIAFRWIDRDVKDDTILNNSTHFNGEMERGDEATIVTGSYNWRQIENPPPVGSKRATLLEDINAAEKNIRSEWYRLQSTYNVGFTSQFYLPEPNLYLNTVAHTAWAGRTPTRSTEDAQSRESEYFYDALKDRVTFLPSITVSKPIKNQGVISKDYLPILGKYTEAIGRRRRIKKINKTDFLQDLNDIRQSAFSNGNWCFSHEARVTDWKKKTETEWTAMEAAEAPTANDVKAQCLLNAERCRQADTIYTHLTAP